MFSIAAINDTASSGQWEPLEPTKEAQEFQLSQTYHEGLLKLQAKDYEKARELLEAVLKDPLMSSSEVNDSSSDGHLSQLRFLSLKNLASVFLQQGSMHYENALRCYLQAVEIDATDSVLWNQLGTLSCSMSLLSTSRWAFEQGLLCSPNNWNCMEKLLEILIAIGDEVACLSMADMILRRWPSHSRALYVKKIIEDAEPIPFAPRGIDKLEPKHVRLKFPDKRKATDDINKDAKTKRPNQNIKLLLAEATWATLTDAILGILLHSVENHSKTGVLHDHEDAAHENMVNKQAKVISGDRSRDEEILDKDEKIEKYGDIKIDIHLCTSSDMTDPAEGKGPSVCTTGETKSLAHGFDKMNIVKEKEILADKEHPHERRSTRLERLRSRKSGRGESEATGKDQAKVVFQFLGPFTLNRSYTEAHNSSGDSGGSCIDDFTYSPVPENNSVERFISQTSRNFGAYHIGHMLLEEVANLKLPFQDSFIKFLELEKLTKHWGQDRSSLCSLFLAELYYDQGSRFTNEPKRLEFFSEASHHLCKVIESVTLNSPSDFARNSLSIREMIDFNKIKPLDFMTENGDIALNDSSPRTNLAMPESSGTELSTEQNPILSKSPAFWVRFFWLSGQLSLSSGCKEKAFNEFCICLAFLTSAKKVEETEDIVFLPHCKFVKVINTDGVLHEINLLRLNSLLGKTIDGMIEKGMYSKCIDFLAPLLLSTKDISLEILSSAPKESENALSVELSALAVLMLACEKEDSLNIGVYLSCHRRKLQLLAAAAGLVNSPLQKDKYLLSKTTSISDLDTREATNKRWMDMVTEEVKGISQSATRVKSLINQSDTFGGFNSLVSTIGDIQSLLLAVMCSVVRRILSQKCTSSEVSNQLDQSESWCLVDAAITFCKLQHLDPSIPIKVQVDLVVAVHDFLAEYGLCCAGRDSEGEEGTYLKLAIKHLLALDVKLKSINGSTNGKEENATVQKDPPEDLKLVTYEGTAGEGLETGLVSIEKLDCSREKSEKCIISDADSHPAESELENIEQGIESALEQCLFCLYGLNINPDSLSEDDLAIHKNTNRGDYQTKEQCADVFHYILPYAGALSRAGLVKLRKVLRAIRKHFPQPANETLAENAIEKFLDGSDLCEDKLCDISGSNKGPEYIMDILFTNGRGPETLKTSVRGSEPYLEVYGNLYYLIAQAEEISASDKYPGFVLKKEGEEFVEQNANLFKYDLMYNPLRFESWQKLANIYDELTLPLCETYHEVLSPGIQEVDLLLNDGSKHVNVVDWRKNTTLSRRVDIGRRRSRRCLLMSLALSNTAVQKSQMHELLALVYYDSLQNVVPFYDQRSVVPTKDAVWMTFCQNSMKHFDKAFELRPDWIHAFYLGKLCEKMGYSSAKAFSYYNKAATLNPSSVDPVYRMHASRLKLLCTRGKQNLDILQIVAAYAFNQSTKETILNIFSCTYHDLMQSILDVKDVCTSANSDRKYIEPSLLDKAWHILFDDCLKALEVCVEGELKPFHKARYRIALGLYERNEDGDLERAKGELSFCFKSSRSSFTVNMWEIDGTAKKGRRKNPGLAGNKKNLEVSLSESSRKFISCIRKYVLLYLNLLEKTGDLGTLEKAYVYLRTDKRFSLCLGDIVPVAIGKYMRALTLAVRNAETHRTTNNTSLEQMLERMFNIFIDHVNIWTDISDLPEVNSPDISESSLYGCIHQYIHLLESDVRLDALEGINEKIRKRFKSPKLSNTNCAKVCKHASLAWCRCILIKLVLITPASDGGNPSSQPCVQTGPLLFVDLQPDEFFNSSVEDNDHSRLDMDRYQVLTNIKNFCIRQVVEEDMESAVALMRGAYNFYKESSYGTIPSGINLYTVFSSQSALEEPPQPNRDGVDILDLSIPRKLLLWAYTLVHGRYLNISAVVKYCEENEKSRMKRGAMTSATLSQGNMISGSITITQASVISGLTHAVPATVRHDRCESVEVADNSLNGMPSVLHQEDAACGSNISPASNELPKSYAAALQLQGCTLPKILETDQEGCDGSHVTK